MGGEMARKIERLNALKVSRTAKPGLHPDGGGLYLQVTAGGSRTWILRYRYGGRRRDMGLGALGAVSLADARAAARAARALLAKGTDPIEHRRAARAEAKGAAVTFADAAVRCIADRRDGWKNQKHRAQWSVSLERYANPVLGKVPLAALRPIWLAKPETARRVRQRIEAVLDFAQVHGLRNGANPARLKGNLDALLPKADRGEQAHHAAMALAALPGFMRRLRRQPGMAAIAMQILTWTATRTSEALLARWEEFDLDGATWTIPGARTKTGATHRIPLPAPAVELLRDLAALRRCDWVFERAGKPLSTGALLALMRRMGADATPHGMRSCFRDWAARETIYPSELAEIALAHRVGSRVTRAYQRDDLLERRRPMMADWAQFLDRRDAGEAGNVIAIRAVSS
jgi:integrase